MSDYIIKVENLGKKYKIRHQQDQQRYVALRDVIASKAAAPLRWLRQHGAWSIEHGVRNMQYGAAGNGRPSPDSQLPASGSELVAPRSQLQAPSSVLPAPSSPLHAPNSEFQAPGSLLHAPSSLLPTEEFWALRDVSFEVKQGEVLGIIGRNGAGKSTLLKILSRITKPTEGRVRIRGRVASLLEVGTGFHPELTGRENIFLNGAILGMSREEIKRNFDQIVDFSGVEKFIDTPVKRFSSGMYVRLAFAVAAHLEPEILVIDEVLAVGDGEFQKKCLGKIEDVAGEGRTVLFVSHNMAAVEVLCHSAMLLSRGKLIGKGDTIPIITHYLGNMGYDRVELHARADRQGSGVIRFTQVSLVGSDGKPLKALQCGAEARIILTFENFSNRELRNVSISLGIDNQFEQRVLLLDSSLSGHDLKKLDLGAKQITVFIPKLSLIPGRYHLTIFSTVNGAIADWVKDAWFFDVEPGDYYGTGRLPDEGQGLFLIGHSFTYE